MMCVFEPLEHVSRDTCYLNTIAVDDTCRGRGIGKVLLDFADEEARRRNCKVRVT